MPGRNKTGPMGEGPMTGRGAGPCAGDNANQPGPAGRGRGQGGGGGRGRGQGGGFGRGRGAGGGGRGWRHWFHATGLPGWMRRGGEAPAAPDAKTGDEEDQK